MLLLAALLVWPLVAFGGRSAATAFSVGAVCLVWALVTRPRLSATLDRTLLAVLALVALQLLPLPGVLRAVLSPHAAAVHDAFAVAGAEGGHVLPLSIRPASTAWAWMVVAGAVAFFWVARAQFSRGGVRLTVRTISAVGFGLALFAIAQRATAGRSIYWMFPTEFEGPLPFGPFINRNHFATWMILALPLCLGYIAARTGQRPEQAAHIATRTRIVEGIDPRTIWLTAAATTMAIALLLSLSRSGTVALAVSSLVTIVVCRTRLDRRRRRGVLVSAAVVILLGLGWADIPALRQRLEGTHSGLVDRMTIWRETLPVVRDFVVTGTGAGTYEPAMYVYQRSPRTVYFNQAHNHYLQVVTEGGVVLSAAVLAALVALVLAARRRIAGDASGVAWIRIGAAGGLGAVALQSIWETGLVMPANALMAALLAAIVVHERHEPPVTDSERGPARRRYHT